MRDLSSVRSDILLMQHVLVTPRQDIVHGFRPRVAHYADVILYLHNTYPVVVRKAGRCAVILCMNTSYLGVVNGMIGALRLFD